jgi:tagatose-1,6-bisphosphate aldolase
MNNIFNHVKQNPYDITVTNHSNYTASTRSLDYVITNIESDLSPYSSILMHQNAYETVSSQQTFKRASAMLIMTDEKAFGEPSVNTTLKPPLFAEFNDMQIFPH